MKINILESARKEMEQYHGKNIRIYQSGAG